MSDSQRNVFICLASYGLAATTIIGLTGIGLDLRFAHIFGYALGTICYFAVTRLAATQVGFAQIEITFSILAVANAVSLLALSWILAKTSLNPYIGEIAASLVFALVLWGSHKAIVKIVDLKLISGVWATYSAFGKLMPRVLIIGLAAVSIFSVVVFYQSLDARAELPVGSRVQPWIDAAQCFAKTGKILVLCADSGKFETIEMANVADDRGHSLLLSAAHGWFGVEASKRSLVLINYFITVVGIALLAAYIGRNGWPIAASVLFFSGPIIATAPFVTADTSGAYYGLFSLVLLMPIQLLRMLLLDRMPKVEWLWFLLSAMALIFAAIIRQPYGMMGVVTALAFILVGLMLRGRQHYFHSFAITMAALVAFFVAVNAAQLAFSFRANIQGIAQEEGIITHGIIHSLFIGLGAEENSFGLKYADGYGEMAVQKVDSNIVFASNEYFDVLFQLYLEIVRKHPGEVLWIYTTKFGKSFGPIVLPVLLLLLAPIMLGSALTPISKGTSLPVYLVVSPIIFLTILNTMQGVLTTPSGNNFPLVAAFVALLAMVVDVWSRVLAKENTLKGRMKKRYI